MQVTLERVWVFLKSLWVALTNEMSPRLQFLARADNSCASGGGERSLSKDVTC